MAKAIGRPPLIGNANKGSVPRWDSAGAVVGLRAYQKLARRSGLVECYVAEWHCYGGALEGRRKLRIRAHRYRRRATIKSEAFDGWQDSQSEVKWRYLTVTEWQELVEWVDASDFWQLPNSHLPSSAIFHQEAWVVEGFRDDRYHFVRRTTCSLFDGVGAEVFHLGESMARLAGLTRLEIAGN